MSLHKDIRARRTADQIMRGLITGHIHPASVSDAECPLLLRHCAQRVKRIQARVAQEASKGRHRIARQRQRDLFEGPASRLLAAWQACKKADALRRRRYHESPILVTFDRIWLIAEQLKNLHAPSRAIFRTKRKPGGGERGYFEFDEIGTAKQKLFVSAILPFASFHSSQFALRRGRSAACRSLLKVMRRLLLANTRFIQSDIIDFYGSISRTYLERVLPAPKAIIRSSLFLDGWSITGAANTEARRGIPQGSSASSLVAEMVMANVLRDAADRIADLNWLHSYSDNVGGFLLPNKDEATLVENLRNAFLTHPAGPFCIRIDRSRISQPFRFLGYSWVRPKLNHARALLPAETWQLKVMEFTTAFSNAETRGEMLKICVQLRSYCLAFELAAETRVLFNRVTQFMHAELASRDSRSRP